MNCKHCGEPLTEGAKFCENCGSKVEEEIEKVEYTSATEEYKEPERVEAEVVSEGPKASTSDDFESAPKAEVPKADAPKSDMGPIGYSIASLVCGILGLLCCCCGFVGLILSGAGIALGIISINKNCEGRGMAIAGIACGGVGAALVIISFIVSAASGNFGLDNALDVTDQLEDFLDSL